MRKNLAKIFIAIILFSLFLSCGSSSENGFPLGECNKGCERVFTTCEISSDYFQTPCDTASGYSGSYSLGKDNCFSCCNYLDYVWEDYDKDEQLARLNWVNCLNIMDCDYIKDKLERGYDPCY
ncbi:MAG: hypothetical protein AB1465_06035 [Patescibacteria group bacterium]